MSKAFKCDRCKKCFDPYALKGDEYFTTIKEFFCQTGVEFSNNEFGYREEGAHLCPDCSVAFLRFCDCRDEKTGKETKSDDRVNHPNHYTFSDIEVIEKPYLIACKCPNCDTIFTLEFPSRRDWLKYECYMKKCPGCGKVENWVDWRIFKWVYKLIRYSRERKNCKAPNEKEGV